MDVVIPYGGDGESIKYALRSIEKNFDYGNIFIVTDKPCHHLNHKNLFFINKGDKHMSNKDANLAKTEWMKSLFFGLMTKLF